MAPYVVSWISDDEASQREWSCGGLGGWFKEDNTWIEYVEDTHPEARPYIEAIKDDVLATGRFITGRQHQETPDGVPLFDDGTVGAFSYRAWGDLMAAIATLKDDKGHHYMEFYC